MIVDITSEIIFLIYSEETELKLNSPKTINSWLFEPKQMRTNKGPFQGIEVTGSFEFADEFSEEIVRDRTIDFSLIRKSVTNKITSHREIIFSTIVRPFVDALSLNLKIPIYIKEKEKWTNETELKNDLEQQGFSLKNKGVFVPQSLIGSLSGSEEITALFEYFQNNIYNLTVDNKKEVSRIIGWLEKGLAQDDYYDEFICYWIAFNALYNLVSEKSGRTLKKETERFEFLISIIFADNLICEDFIVILRRKNKTSIDYLCQLELLSATGRSDWATELSRLESENNLTGDYIKTLARCIYVLRKNLFHGALSVSERDKDISQCLPLLKELSFNSLNQVLTQRILSCAFI